MALLVVQLLFGTAPVLGKAALQAFPSYAIVGFRVGGAAMAFAIFQRLRSNLQLERRSDYFRFALYSLFGVVLNQLFYFKGLSLTTATNTALLAVTIPVFALLISLVLGSERLTVLKILGVSLAAIGVISLINPTKASFSSETTQGDILIILNSLFYAAYVVLSKNLIIRYGALKSIAWFFLFGSLINVPVGLISLQSVELSQVSLNAWLALGAVILFPTIGAYYLNAWALERADPSIVAVYVYLQPLFGFIGAVLFLNEKITVWTLLSTLLIFAGVFLVTRRRKIQQPARIEV